MIMLCVSHTQPITQVDDLDVEAERDEIFLEINQNLRARHETIQQLHDLAENADLNYKSKGLRIHVSAF